MTAKKEEGATVTMHFDVALPCTTQDCPNLATVGTASYDTRQNAWILFPLCRSCVKNLMADYRVDKESEQG